MSPVGDERRAAAPSSSVAQAPRPSIYIDQAGGVGFDQVPSIRDVVIVSLMDFDESDEDVARLMGLIEGLSDAELADYMDNIYYKGQGTQAQAQDGYESSREELQQRWLHAPESCS